MKVVDDRLKSEPYICNIFPLNEHPDAYNVLPPAPVDAPPKIPPAFIVPTVLPVILPIE
jgi:hypothetical protein